MIFAASQGDHGGRARVQAARVLQRTRPHPLCADIVAKVFVALVSKNSPGRRREFRVKMWGTSLPEDKLTGDLGNVIETT